MLFCEKQGFCIDFSFSGIFTLMVVMVLAASKTLPNAQLYAMRTAQERKRHK